MFRSRRPPGPLRPFDAAAAAAILGAMRDGERLDEALARARVPEQLIFAWLQHAQRRDQGPELAPYVAFAAEFRRITVDRSEPHLRLVGAAREKLAARLGVDPEDLGALDTASISDDGATFRAVNPRTGRLVTVAVRWGERVAKAKTSEGIPTDARHRN